MERSRVVALTVGLAEHITRLFEVDVATVQRIGKAVLAGDRELEIRTPAEEQVARLLETNRSGNAIQPRVRDTAPGRYLGRVRERPPHPGPRGRALLAAREDPCAALEARGARAQRPGRRGAATRGGTLARPDREVALARVVDGLPRARNGPRARTDPGLGARRADRRRGLPDPPWRDTQRAFLRGAPGARERRSRHRVGAAAMSLRNLSLWAGSALEGTCPRGPARDREPLHPVSRSRCGRSLPGMPSAVATVE